MIVAVPLESLVDPVAEVETVEDEMAIGDDDDAEAEEEVDESIGPSDNIERIVRGAAAKRRRERALDIIYAMPSDTTTDEISLVPSC